MRDSDGIRLPDLPPPLSYVQETRDIVTAGLKGGLLCLGYSI